MNSVKNVRLQRTSTPIPDIGEDSLPFFDAVSEFFYQSWKTELESDESVASQPDVTSVHPVQPVQETVYYTQTVIFYPLQPYYVPAYCYPVVGYRPDGTYGVISSCSCGWHLGC